MLSTVYFLDKRGKGRMIDPNELAADLASAIGDKPTTVKWNEGNGGAGLSFSALVSPLHDVAELVMGGEKYKGKLSVTAVKSVFPNRIYPPHHNHFTIDGKVLKIEAVNIDVATPVIYFEVDAHE